MIVQERVLDVLLERLAPTGAVAAQQVRDGRQPRRRGRLRRAGRPPRGRQRDAIGAEPAVDPEPGVEGLEVGVELADALGRPEKEAAVATQREVERGDDPLLHGLLELGEHVAARDEVHVRDGRIGDEVVRREHHALAQRGAGHERVAVAHEVARQTLGRDAGDPLPGVARAGGAIDRLGTDVGGEDLDAPVPAGALLRLVEQDRERPGLFAGGAARHPGAQLAAVLVALDEPAHDGGIQAGERVGIAEEARGLDEQSPSERAELVLVRLEQRQVAAETVDAVDVHASLDPPRHRRRLVVREVDAAVRAQQLEHARERPLVALELARQVPARAGHEGVAGIAPETRGEVRGMEREIGRCLGPARRRARLGLVR